MADPYIGEIRMFAGNYAPVHWALCNGQILAVNSNQALFSLLGNNYGGDGISTFGLPELRGSVPVGEGAGIGLTPRPMGQRTGTEIVHLGIQNMPPHSHNLMPSSNAASNTQSDGNVAANVAPYEMYETFNSPADIVQLNENCIGATGGDQPHDNMMPFMNISFIISMKGVYPPRS